MKLYEKQSKKILENPKIDGREIALTHSSAKILQELDVWSHIPTKLISTILDLILLSDPTKINITVV